MNKFKMNPGRGDFNKTGHGLPFGLTSGSPLRVEGEIDPKLQEKANKLAEQKRAADKSNITSGEKKKYSAEVTDIKLAKTPEEVAKWKESVGKPGAGRLIQKASATVYKEGSSDLKPVGPTTPSLTTSAPIPAIKDKPQTRSTGMSWTREDVDHKMGTGTTWGMSPTNSSEIKAGVRKQGIDTDPNLTSQGKAFSTGEKNQYRSQEVTFREKALMDRKLLSGNNNPIGTDPAKYEAFLTKQEGRMTQQDKTLAERAANRQKAKDARSAALAASKRQ